MILLHAAEAPHDVPGIGLQRGEPIFHLLSDQPWPHGTAELLAFTRAFGGHDSWLQAPGSYREHFDLFGEWAERALALGATPATNAQVAAALSAKRAAMSGLPPSVPALTSRQRHAADEIFRRSDPRAWQRMHETQTPARIVEAIALLTGPDLTRKRIMVACIGRRSALARAAARELARTGALVTLCVLDDAEHPLACDRADLILDLLAPIEIGSGAAGMEGAISAIERSGVPVLSVDLPSGLDPNEGGPRLPVVHASATLALGMPLRGLALSAARPLAGDLWLGDVGFSPRALKRVGAHVGAWLAATPLARLERKPLAGDLLPSDVDLLCLA